MMKRGELPPIMVVFNIIEALEGEYTFYALLFFTSDEHHEVEEDTIMGSVVFNIAKLLRYQIMVLKHGLKRKWKISKEKEPFQMDLFMFIASLYSESSLLRIQARRVDFLDMTQAAPTQDFSIP
nr:hypothetical protein [Tanacetum cinerariifolium]